MRRVLITGISGYIGSRLARRLLPKCAVYGLVRTLVHEEYLSGIQDQITLLPYDGSYESMEQALRKSRPDLVYHLAAYYTGRHGPEDTPRLVQSNIVLGANLLEAMTTCGCSALIWATTVMARYQGEAYRPLNLYAATKQAFADLLAYYTDAGLLKAGTLVLSDTYGPGDRRPKILNLIKQAVKKEEPIALSDGTQDYDLVYIDDVTAAFELAGRQLLAGEWSNQAFQVYPEQPLSLRETVETMLRVNGLALQAGWGQRPAAERDMRKAVRLHPAVPGWRAEVPLEEGLYRFWQES